MKVLVLCNDFPPLNSIGAQRPFAWYQHLKDFGVEPVVITKNWKGHSATPQDVLRNAGDRNAVTDVSPLGTVIRVPLETTPSERMLLKYGESKQRGLRRALTFGYRLGAFVFTRMDPHRNIFFEADRYLARNNVHGIVATGEPHILFRYCYLLHKKHNVPWVADYRDGWQNNYVRRTFRDPLNRFLLRYESAFENKYLQSAACITSVDPVLTKALAALHRKPAEVVYNGFDDFYDGPKETLSNGVPLVLNHVGTLTPGQRVEPFLQAVKELLAENKVKPSELSIRFIGLDYFPEQRRRVLSFDASVTACIATTPRVPRVEVLRMNTGADYLLTFTETTHPVINAKTYDYIAAKRPILVMPKDAGLLSDLVADLNAGESLNSVEDIKAFLHQAVQRKRNGRGIHAYPLNEEKALFYTRRRQTEQMAIVLRKYFA